MDNYRKFKFVTLFRSQLSLRGVAHTDVAISCNIQHFS